MGRFRAHALTSRADFRKVYRQGTAERAPHLVVRALQRPIAGQHGRFAVIVSRKLGGAVQRNRIRRRIRESVRQMGGPSEGMDAVWVAQAGIEKLSFEQIGQEVSEVMEKIGKRCVRLP